jgi:hypothetical protein
MIKDVFLTKISDNKLGPSCPDSSIALMCPSAASRMSPGSQWGAKSASQDIAEWKTCRDIVSSRWENLLWLDIRGNHDNLDVLSRNHSYNYFAMFSVMGLKGHLGSYVESLQTRG